jgi:hypothetical protein
MRKYFAFELTIPDDQFLPPYWQQQRAADNLASVLWLYERAPDPQLLELAKKIHRHTANWTDGIPDWHNVNMAQAFGGPATYWRVSRDRKHLDAAERNFRTIRETYGQVPGGMFGGDENCRPGFADPRQAIETCGMVEMMLSCERLFAITGDAVWAERCEDVAYNSLPAAFMPDYSGLRYLTSPNMVQSDASPKAPGLQNGGNMLEMRCDDHRCCQHNAGHGWPYFSEHAWMATQDGGLALVFPVASRVETKGAGRPRRRDRRRIALPVRRHDPTAHEHRRRGRVPVDDPRPARMHAAVGRARRRCVGTRRTQLIDALRAHLRERRRRRSALRDDAEHSRVGRQSRQRVGRRWAADVLAADRRALPQVVGPRVVPPATRSTRRRRGTTG